MSAKPKSRWRRRALWFAIALVAARLLLALLLPWLVLLGAGQAGLDVSYRSASLSLLGLSLRFEDLEVRVEQFPADPPLLRAQEVVVDLAMAQLLRGKIGIVDAAIDGAHIELHRDDTGRLHLPKQWTEATAPVAPEPVPPVEQPVRFDLTLQVASARVHDLRLRFHDAAVSPPKTTELTLDADVTDLGWTDRPGAIAVRLHGPQWFDDFRVAATTTTTPERLAVTWQVDLRGLRPDSLPLPKAALEPLACVPTLHLALRGELHGQTVPNAPRRPTIAGEIHFDTDLGQHRHLTGDVTAGPCRNTTLGVELPFAVSLHSDDLFDRLQLQSGLASIEPEHLALGAQLAAAGIELSLLAPWLAKAGVTLPAGGLEAHAEFTANVHSVAGSSPSLSVQIAQLSLGRGDERLDLARLAIVDVSRTGDEIAIGSVEIEGPELAIVARPNELSVAGIRLLPPPPATQPTSATPPPATPPATAPTMPRATLGKLAWRGMRVAFTDTTLATPATLTLADGTVSAENLALGRSASPCRIIATARVPDSTGELRAELRLAPTPNAVAIEADITASDVTAAGLAPWLQPLGVRPALQAAHFAMAASAEVAIEHGTLAASARLANVRFVDGGVLLGSLRNLELRELRAGRQELSLGALTIDAPFLNVRREMPETLSALGFEYRRPTAPPAADPTSKAAAPAPDANAQTTAGPQLHRGPVTLRDGVVLWTHAARPSIALGADLTLGADDGSGAAVPFDATLRLGEAIEALQLRGTVAMAPTSMQLETQLEGRGLRGPALSQLLPASVTCTLNEGALRASLSAELTTAPSNSLHVLAANVRFSDQGQELAAIDTAELLAPELSAEQIHIARLQVSGVRAETATTQAGLHVPGFLLRPLTSATHPALGPGAAPNAPAAAAPALAGTKPARLSLAPAMRIDAIDIDVERITWRERMQLDGEPLVVSMRLVLDAPWATAPDFAETVPARFTVHASAMPLCRDVHIAAALRPFELQPTLDLELGAEGIDTKSLERVVPRLADRLQGTATDAQLTAKLHASLGLRRREPRQFDFSRPFGGELFIEGVEFRASPDGPVLASVAAIEVLARTFDPRTGDLLLRTVTVDTPLLQARRTAAGMELLGLRLAPPPSAIGDEPAATPPTPTTPARPAAATPPEFAIDRLQVQGLAFAFADDTTDPPTRLPFEDVDLELRCFSNRALTEPRPLTFNLAVRGGETTLEKRVIRSSVIAGFLTSTVGALAGQADQYAPEQRPLLDEFSITGQLQMYPRLTGKIHTSISSFELPALRGLAKTSGVDLADGVLDLRLDATLEPGGVDIENRTTFTWLSLTEPPGGPISTYLRLPAPLDTVLFLLRNEDDEHRLPMQLHVPAEGLSTGAIAGAAAEAVLKIVADAVAGAAMRTTGALTGAIGLGGGPDLRTLTAAATFAAGDPMAQSAAAQSSAAQSSAAQSPATQSPATQSPATQRGDLATLVDAVAGDPGLSIVLTHEFGEGDLARAAELANPPLPVVAETVQRLRQERDVTASHRHELAAQVAAHFAAGQMHDARHKQGELSRLDDGLGRLELTIDEALGMLAAPNARTAQRRTKAAALAMAQARLQALAEDLRRRLPGRGAVIETRQPRAIATAGLPAGGRIVVSLRRGQAP
ncbi:MAG: DUF748 domain-containing protein [Planctomycetota bacterium]